MAILSSLWTGREPGGVMVAERPPIHSDKPKCRTVEVPHQTQLDEYAELASALGIAAPDIEIEAFKEFLAKHDIPTFSLVQVVSYMDDKAAKESKDKCGWEWRPLRARDNRRDLEFGSKAMREKEWRSNSIITTPASDYYKGPHKAGYEDGRGGIREYEAGASSSPYDKTIPIHALRKAALIDKTFGGKIALFVCDYALAPAIQYPDPFLMAVIPNANVASGVGRFIIDFWDEPGFGLQQRLA